MAQAVVLFDIVIAAMTRATAVDAALADWTSPRRTLSPGHKAALVPLGQGDIGLHASE